MSLKLYNAYVLNADGEKLRIWCGQNLIPTEPGETGAQRVELTCAEWARRSGRGFLCTSEA